MRTKSFLFFLAFFTLSFVSGQTKDRLPCVDKEFSVTVHIIKDSLGNPGISEGTIQGNFDELNSDFAPICASFKICEFVYHDNFKYDSLSMEEETSELQGLYNKLKRINVYYVDTIYEYNDLKVCGFANLGGIGNVFSGGICIAKRYGCCDSGAKVLAHEFGHYFNLEHTFNQSGAELVDGSNCTTAGDYICDTPSDPFIDTDDPAQYVDPLTCLFISMKKDANGDYYHPLVGNIMSYYQTPCKCGFTHQQFLRMANYYLSNQGMW